MNKEELLNKVNELVGEGNVDKAKQLIEDNKDHLGEYYEKAQGFLKDNEGNLEGILDKVKGFFGK